MTPLYVGTIDDPRAADEGRDSSREATLSNRTYRVTEIVGTSPDGIDQAIRNGIDRAARTLRHVDWFEVTQVRGQVKDGAVEHFQVGMKVGFRLEDD
jgi:flavin-binding protein dodecin